jgi:DNA-binding MarR family transcriptional regulator
VAARRASAIYDRALARNIRVLVKLGLVEMTTSPADRRAAALVLTQKAVSVTAEALPLWQSAQAEIEKTLTATSAAELRHLALSI